MRRRGLGDVLHYFIPEEEQREARARVRATRPRPHASAPAWCLPASPESLLSCAIAIDLAVAAARGGSRVEILAPFPRHRLLPRAPEVAWRQIELADAGAEVLERSLQERPPGARSFVLLPPTQLGSLLPQLPTGAVDGVLVPLEATPQAPAQALSLLRQLSPLVSELRIGAVLVGARSAAEAHQTLEKLARAARRQLGLELEELGELRRGPATFRSLLHGLSVLDVDEEGSTARSVRDLCERL